MDIGPSNPVTLVVKAPNQRIADQTIECMLGWTVKKLKEHLSSVYPSKPEEKEQKLIYSGRLLQDHLMLKDILRQYGEDTQHTVHLVCSPTSEGSSGYTDSQPRNSMVNKPVPPASSSAQSGGLRHRRPEPTPVSTQPPTHVPHSYAQQAALWNQYIEQMGYQIPSQMNHQMVPPAVNHMAYNPQQYMWMQQMYAQYMANYMQYYQTATASSTPPTTPPANAQPLPQVPNPAANLRNAQQPANQNIRMNAQGGPVDDDDEDEFGQRDWLDWVYTFSRFGVLLSIVYFYSTMSRFIVVFLFFFVVYLYEKGWFRFRRRQEPEVVAQQAEQQQQQPAAPAQPDGNQPVGAEVPPNQTGEGDLAGNNAQSENEIQETPEDSEVMGDNSGEAQAEEARPGALTLLWCFVVTFFTSLIPQPPPAVNLN
ncbi:homocysteine-responsive endoplasmic reticulum-resident ubiquitin-like domain member 2 protein [Liolophura sinensis]|uniref:homocysteine-responsive endoplasmic reticulum-resident ubiquitin-like domain member 2 protein n=1 Tax=Liolophura sinensis TaxID=3198878 RepID=UPI00315824AA